jgi:hypothetical protein
MSCNSSISLVVGIIGWSCVDRSLCYIALYLGWDYNLTNQKGAVYQMVLLYLIFIRSYCVLAAIGHILNVTQAGIRSKAAICHTIVNVKNHHLL